ncbi:Peroxidase 2 [Dichanthelium oligosanthes]|uniref:Peroxidase 2 n=1 Tax=Dichanthelium oligosanthes TaxID=888268 RepID=A0A1E5W8V2_9POAL|nr:Peroxidase 2 [Dichanthelium oligosanthes]
MAKLISAAAVASLCCCALFVCLLAGGQAAEAGGGGYYYRSPLENTIRGLVEKAIKDDSRVGPALVRLLFHDCWVYGCDGSVLLDWTPYDLYNTEKNASNNIGLNGFDLIDRIKLVVGDQASCANILAYAARDAASILSNGNIDYPVPGDLKDGVRSSPAYADAELPGSTFSFAQLKANFAKKEFSVEDLVILSGAHSVGVCHDSSFADRLNPQVAADGEINPRYQFALALYVKRQRDANPTVQNNIRDMDAFSQLVAGYYAGGAKGVLDNSYYQANLDKKVLLKSDWELTQDKDAAKKLVEYRDNATDWNIDFANALARLSDLRPAKDEYPYPLESCDGSVLLDEAPADGGNTEKKAAKSIGLGGFDLIDRIKARLAAAGDDASCADILAFAARDATNILSGGRIRYAVHRGRGDGVTSSADAALPAPAASSFAELEESFAARGFGKGDLSALSGAHAVGVCHGSSFADRLRPSVAAAYQINGTYQLALVARRQKLLLQQTASDTTTTTAEMMVNNNVRDMDPAFRAASSYSGVGVDTAATGALDNSYYTANLQNMVLLKSDWELTQDKDTLARLVAYRDDAAKWSKDFGEAMERLSNLRPPVGVRLEIRKNCRLTNLSPGQAVCVVISIGCNARCLA